jgi:hypothetical protein
MTPTRPLVERSGPRHAPPGSQRPAGPRSGWLGMCTVLVRRIDGRGELLFHACPETGAVLSPAQAVEIAAALTAAAEDR